MNTVIIGGGKVGASLAKSLSESGDTVTVVEVNPERCEVLTQKLPKVTIICGDGDEPYVLDEANARSADAIVAATGHDEDNLVVCLLGKYEYGAAKTIARINNGDNAWLFNDRFGVDIPVSNTAIMAEVLRHVSLGDIVTMLQLKADNMVIDEVVLPGDSDVVGKRLADLRLPEGCQVMVIVSEAGVVVPRGDTVLNAGDELLILAKNEREAELKQLFSSGG
ncbi:MAG: NAD-binding protein [Coriobacteriia bacterium]|nr:NAD-binding protein [Coriobacteriia bacterium]